MLHTVTSALLLVVSLFAGVRADDGSIDFNHECLNVPTVGQACLNFGVRTCGALGLYFNMTIAGALVYQTSITDLTQQTVCQTRSPPTNPCYLCMGVASGSGDKFVLEPGYAHICPTVIVMCRNPISGTDAPISTKQLDCLDVGVPCSTYTSCNECTSTLTCGWCGSSSSSGPAQSSSSSSSGVVEQGACLRRGRGATPFCSSCPAVTQPFFVNNNQCPTPPPSDNKSSSTGIVLIGVGVSVGCLIIIGVVLYFVFRSYMAKKNGYAHHQLEMHDQDNHSAHAGGPSVLHADLEASSITTSGSLNSPISEADTYRPPTLKENQMPLVSHEQSDAVPDDL